MSVSRILSKYIGESLILSARVAGVAQCRIKHSDTTKKADDSDCSTKQLPKKRGKTPIGKLDDEFDDAPLSYDEKEPLAKHPGGVNPATGEYGGPSGPEPTRYGDWERKGRVSDF